MSLRRPNIFAGPFAERWGARRCDVAWLEHISHSSECRLVPVWRNRNLLTEDPPGAVLLDPPSPNASGEKIFLGRFRETWCFAIEVHGDEPPSLHPHARFLDLHRTGALLEPAEAGLLAYARAMVQWRRNHAYCSRCGALTQPEAGGHVLRCTAAQCARPQFPRIDPAIIVLVHDDERCLLGRQATWPEGVYSTIAGFVEPGESLEDAVAREVEEETGVRVDDIRYHSSQPWPFPASLMLGFTARATSREIRLHDGELEDARWFDRSALASGTPTLPSRVSISFRLIEDWHDAAAAVPLVRSSTARFRW